MTTRGIMLGMFVLMGLLGLSGCVETRVVNSTWDSFAEEWQGRGEREAREGVGSSSVYQPTAQDRIWAVTVDRFSGPNRSNNAQVLATRLSGQHAINPIWIEDRGGVTSVYAGRFETLDDPGVEPLLARLRRVNMDGVTPYANVTIEPVRGVLREGRDQYDLTAYPGYFTLQVGFYDNDFEGDGIRAAKRKVEQLREEGHEAYYYPGPTMAIVGVGLWTRDEALVMRPSPMNPSMYVEAYSESVNAAREAFPYVFINDFAASTTTHSGTTQTRSALVPIPE